MPLKSRFKPQKPRYAKTQLSLFPDTMQSDIVSDLTLNFLALVGSCSNPKISFERSFLFLNITVTLLLSKIFGYLLLLRGKLSNKWLVNQ